MEKDKKLRALLALDKDAARAAGYSLSAAIAAGYSLSAARAAGYSLSEAIAAGYSLSEARAAGYSEEDIQEWDSITVLDKPYSRLLNDIEAKRRIHRQSTWGPEDGVKEENVCGTPMCTASHLVNMAGSTGYALKNKYGWKNAAALIHYKTHPDFPLQNFAAIEQANALAYIEAMAEWEETGVNPLAKND